MSIRLSLLIFLMTASCAVEVTVRDGQHSHVNIAIIVEKISTHQADIFLNNFLDTIQKDCQLYDRLNMKKVNQANADLAYWRQQGFDYIIAMKFASTDHQHLQFSYRLLSPWSASLDSTVNDCPAIEKTFDSIHIKKSRIIAHQFTDLLLEQIFGVRGYASYPLSFVEQQNNKFKLTLADCHGDLKEHLYESKNMLLSQSWANSGQKIAYVELLQDRAVLKIVDVYSKKTVIVDQGPLVTSPLFSKNDRFLFYIKASQGYPHVFRKDLVTGAIEPLTFGQDWLAEIHYSEHDDKLLVTSDRSGQAQIYELDLQTKRLKRLTFTDRFCGKGLWLNHEKSLIFSSFDENKKLVLFKKSLLDRQTTQLTYDGYDEGATQAPAPGLIAFERTSEMGKNVYFKSLFSGKETKFLNAPMSSSPSWSPQPGFDYTAEK